MGNPPSAAQAIYGHLKSAAAEPVQRQQPRLAEAMFPDLVPPKPPTPEERFHQRQRDALVRDLRELNAKLLQRGLKR